VEFVNIKSDFKKPPADAIYNDVCTICSGNIFFIKYSCCICRDMIVCDQCEGGHSHPMIKFKEKELKTKEEVLGYMVKDTLDYNDKEKDIGKVDKGMFKKLRELSDNIFDGKKYKLRLHSFTAKFSVRPNKRFKIPIVLLNETNKTIPNCNILVLTRHNKDLKITPINLGCDIFPKEQHELVLECESNTQLKTYDFEIIVYSPTAKIEAEPLKMQVEVNNDMEEENMNEFLAMYSKILSIPKKEKEIIIRIVKNGISIKHPYIIYNILVRNGWDIDGSMEELSH